MDNSINASETPGSPSRESAMDLVLVFAILVVLALTAVLAIFLVSRPVGTAVAANAPQLQPIDNPVQSAVRGAAVEPMVWEDAGATWTLQPKATYQIAARVLGNKPYSDWESPTVPRDLALGWGEMSDPAVDEWINWRQSGRWYYYTWGNESPFNGRAIGRQSANVHIIPATNNLKKALRDVGTNDLVYLEGRLVDIEMQNGRLERAISTSLTRDDSGNGACEILYVERLTWNGKVYE
jgi:hypothetical protein